MSGMRVVEMVQKLPNDKAYLAFIPFPTELCILCAPRTKKGLDPACVKHCMAHVIKWGRLWKTWPRKWGKTPHGPVVA